MSIWHRNKVFSMIKCLSSVAVKVILVRRSLQLKCVSFIPASPLFYDSCILPCSMHGNFFIINCSTLLPSSVSRSLLLDSELDLLHSNTKENSTGFTPLSLSAHLWRLIRAFSKAISRFKLGSS